MKFETPSEAARVAGMGRTAAYHWFAPIEKMVLPGVDVIVRFADHFELTDEQLGAVIRSRSRLRAHIVRLGKIRREAKKRKLKAEALTRHEIEQKRRREAHQKRDDALIARAVEIEKKEDYLEERERLEKLEKILERGLQ